MDRAEKRSEDRDLGSSAFQGREDEEEPAKEMEQDWLGTQEPTAESTSQWESGPVCPKLLTEPVRQLSWGSGCL